MKIIYHNDLDGHCAGAIAYKYYLDRVKREDRDKIELIEASYGMKLPEFEVDEPVIVLDFSFETPGQFDGLVARTGQITWIDHHKTAIEEFRHLKYLRGVRLVGTAACELAWRYYYPTLVMPEVVQYIGDMDVWKLAYPDTWAVIEGLALLDTQPSNVKGWKELLTKPIPSELLYSGKICLQYRQQYYAKLVKYLSHEMEWLGRKCIVCNCAFTGSSVFDSLDSSQYDLMVTYSDNGSKFTVGLYSKHESVDCGNIAREFGGGGHQNAAGFRCDELPFALA